MVIDFAGIVQSYIFDAGICIAAVVARASGEIIYCSDNWSVDGADVKQCISNWQKRAQFVKFQDIKYACLMNQPEYFSAVNYKEKSFVIGAGSPDPNDRYFILAYAPPGANGTNGYVDVARAATAMKEGGTYMDPNAQLGKGGQVAEAPTGGGAAVNPQLKQEVQDFIGWIKDANGLSGYIQYYLDQNDAAVMSKLAKAYNDFRNVFGF